MATNLNISENQERVPLSVGNRGVLRTITPDNGSPYYVGARAHVTQTAGGAIVTVIDKDGTTTATISNGTDGTDGIGITDISLTSTAGNVDTYTITYDNGDTDTFTVTNGIDGYSPSASVSKVGDTATITITDENGTTTASISDGNIDIFIAEYGVTTYADVKDAWDNEQNIVCEAVDGDYTYLLPLIVFDDDTDTFVFCSEWSAEEKWATLASDDTWDDWINSIAQVQADWNETQVDSPALILNKPSIPTTTSQLTNNSLFARGHIAAFHGTCTTAAGTATKAVTCADFTSADLVAGAMIVVSFSNANSAAVADLKLDVNSTGAYAIKQNNSGTLSNLGDKSYLKASSYPFIFNGSYWICWYDTNTNTIGYTIRTNGLKIPVKTACYRYRICFTSPDGNYLVPANASTSTSATASKTVTTEKIDPFGRIIYYNYTTALSAGDTIGASYQMQQYNGVTLGYSFNRTGAALTMTSNKAVYVKCAPQTDGSAIIDSSTPFVQDLPTTEDGKIYIFLGVATAATTIEFTLEHPVYYYKNGGVRQWTSADIPTAVSQLTNDSGYLTSYTETDPIFSASAAAGISSSDITSWNGKTAVSVSQITSTGTNIADLTIDGTTTHLYAPSGGGGGEVVYCTCTDSASTVAKTATVVSGTFASLDTGSQVAVKFTYTNTATNPTLNVAGTGAKGIRRGGTTYVGTNANESWNAGTVVFLLYDGADWQIVGWLNTTYTGGTGAEIITGTSALNKVWSPQQIHDGISGMLPTVPTVNDATLTIQKNSTNVATFTANASSNVTADISVPTKVSDLNNDSGFITGVTSTDTPTADTIAEFDSSAHINSADMSSQDVSDFVDALAPSGEAISDWTLLDSATFSSLNTITNTVSVDTSKIVEFYIVGACISSYIPKLPARNSYATTGYYYVSAAYGIRTYIDITINSASQLTIRYRLEAKGNNDSYPTYDIYYRYKE